MNNQTFTTAKSMSKHGYNHKADMIRCCRVLLDMADDDPNITDDDLHIMLAQYLGPAPADKNCLAQVVK